MVIFFLTPGFTKNVLGYRVSFEKLTDMVKESADKNRTSKTDKEPEDKETKPEFKDEALPRIGISLPTADLRRWKIDGDLMVGELNAMGYDAAVSYAANDIVTQVEQISNFINEGCEVLIVAAIDGDSLGEVMFDASLHGIPVIAYDRLIYNTDDVSYYVTFDEYLVGVLQGRYVALALDLENAEGPFNIEFTAGNLSDDNSKYYYNGARDALHKYIDSGVLTIGSDQMRYADAATEGWSTEEAKTRAAGIIEDFYSDGTFVDAWICSNDSTALGVIEALEENYDGEYPVVTGLDCDLANVKKIIEGKQAMSVFKDSRILALRTVQMADQIVSGKKVDVNSYTRYNNGVKTLEAYLCDPVFVDADNYEEALIDPGYYFEEMLR
ncbi:MAG: sugar-binding protein [Lachnospiraceae bacterium]|nr:sugar-binding protein [Lachnospiraceae bacterium]